MPLQLDARLAIAPAGFSIAYRAVNTGPAPARVCDVLSHIAVSGTGTPDPTLAYAIPDGEDGALIGKFIVAIPDNMVVEAPEVPFMREIAPGAELVGEVRLALPLALNHPYRRHQPLPPDQHRVLAGLRFMIGYIDMSRVPPNRPVSRVSQPHAPLHVPIYGNAVLVQQTVEYRFDIQASRAVALW